MSVEKANRSGSYGTIFHPISNEPTVSLAVRVPHSWVDTIDASQKSRTDWLREAISHYANYLKCENATVGGTQSDIEVFKTKVAELEANLEITLSRNKYDRDIITELSKNIGRLEVECDRLQEEVAILKRERLIEEIEQLRKNKVDMRQDITILCREIESRDAEISTLREQLSALRRQD